MELEPSPWRWAVSCTTAITKKELPIRLGEMLL
jgi:hypothetical protein